MTTSFEKRRLNVEFFLFFFIFNFETATFIEKNNSIR